MVSWCRVAFLPSALLTCDMFWMKFTSSLSTWSMDMDSVELSISPPSPLPWPYNTQTERTFTPRSYMVQQQHLLIMSGTVHSTQMSYNSNVFGSHSRLDFFIGNLSCQPIWIALVGQLRQLKNTPIGDLIIFLCHF